MVAKYLRINGLIPDVEEKKKRVQGKPLTFEQKIGIEAENLLLATDTEIADDLGVTRYQVWQHLARRGIKPNLSLKGRVDPEKKRELIEVFETMPGISVTDAARIVQGITVPAALETLKDAGFGIKRWRTIDGSSKRAISNKLKHGLRPREVAESVGGISKWKVRRYEMEKQIDRAHLEEARQILHEEQLSRQ